MEGIEKITARISADADQRCEQVRREAEGRVQDMLAQGEKQAQAEDILSAARAQAAEQRRRILAVAQMDARKAVLKAKRDVLDDVFSRVLDAMCRLPGPAMRAWALSQARVALLPGQQVLRAGAGSEAWLDEGFIEELNRAAQGKSTVVWDKTPISARGGFVLQQGGIEANCTLEALLHQRRAGLEAQAADMLFGGGREG
nr:V-type ATP synthase subunit E [bacterium]